jgi:hypothetical protein
MIGPFELKFGQYAGDLIYRRQAKPGTESGKSKDVW